MAINFTDFSRAPIQESPLANLWENAFKGYQMGRAPSIMNEEQKQRELANQLKQLEVEHKPKEFELSDKGKSLANAIQAEALKYLPQKTQLELAYKKALIDKTNRTLDPVAAAAAKKQQDFNIKRINEIEQIAPHLLATAQDVAGIQNLLSNDK